MADVMKEDRVRVFVKTPGNTATTHYDITESEVDQFKQDHLEAFAAINGDSVMPSFSDEPLFKVR